MKNRFRILLALTLALAMVFGNVLTVAADDGDDVLNGNPIVVGNGYVVTYGLADDATEYEGDVKVDNQGYVALEVESNDEEKPSEFKVDGDVEIEKDKGKKDVAAVHVTSEDGGQASAEVTGNVSATTQSEKVDTYAVYATSKDDGSSSAVTVGGNATGDVFAKAGYGGHGDPVGDPTLVGSDGEAGASDDDASGGARTTVNIGGNVTGDVTARAYYGNGDDDYAGASEINVKGSVTGNVEVKAEEGNGPYHDDEGGPEASVTVGKGVTGNVYLESEDGGTSNLTVQDGGVAGQVYVYAYGEGTANLTIQAGGITSEVGYDALYLSTYYATANADITGDITSDDDGVYACAQASENAPALNDVQIKGNITSESEYGVTALEVYSSGTGAVNIISVEGDITAESDSNAFASEFRTSGEGTEIKATITGELVATGGEDGYAGGVGISNYQGTQNITINGNVTATGSEDSVGVDVMAYTDFYYTADADDLDDPIEFTFTMSDMPPYQMMGPVYIGDSEEPLYLIAIGEGDEKKYYVFDEDDVTRDDDEITPMPITIEIPDGLVGVPSPDFMPSSIKVKLSPISDYEIVVDEENPAATELTITGDVTSDSYGAAVYATPGTKTDIVIDGTVKGGDAGLVLMNNTELGNGVTLTVWAVELVDDTAVFSADMGYGAYGPYGPRVMLDSAGGEAEEAKKPALTENKDAEAQLQYIIRVKADQKDIIAAAGDAFDYMGYKVAHENDTVTLKLNIPEGYEVVEAYSDQAQSMKLEKNEKGEYFLTVPRGGAVELSVKLSKLPDPEPDPEPEPEPDKPDAPDTVAITYILGNDTENDHIRTRAAVGEGVALQPAPVRDGYTFLYWQCTDVDPNSSYYKQPDPENDFQFRPGAIYTAKKDINFVAVWQKN